MHCSGLQLAIKLNFVAPARARLRAANPALSRLRIGSYRRCPVAPIGRSVRSYNSVTADGIKRKMCVSDPTAHLHI